MNIKDMICDNLFEAEMRHGEAIEGLPRAEVVKQVYEAMEDWEKSVIYAAALDCDAGEMLCGIGGPEAMGARFKDVVQGEIVKFLDGQTPAYISMS